VNLHPMVFFSRAPALDSIPPAATARSAISRTARLHESPLNQTLSGLIRRDDRERRLDSSENRHPSDPPRRINYAFADQITFDCCAPTASE
jgi:hypothetical protein